MNFQESVRGLPVPECVCAGFWGDQNCSNTRPPLHTWRLLSMGEVHTNDVHNDHHEIINIMIDGDNLSGNLYDGSALAAYGDVVVVTINYRLGVFGRKTSIFLGALFSWYVFQSQSLRK